MLYQIFSLPKANSRLVSVSRRYIKIGWKQYSSDDSELTALGKLLLRENHKNCLLRFRESAACNRNERNKTRALGIGMQ